MHVPALALIVTNLLLLLFRKRQIAVPLLALQGIGLGVHVAVVGAPVVSIVSVLFTNGVVLPGLLHLALPRSTTSGTAGSGLSPFWRVLLAVVSFVVAYLVSDRMGFGLFGVFALSALLSGFGVLTTGATVVSQMAGYLVLQNGVAASIMCLLGMVPFALEVIEAAELLFFVGAMTIAVRRMGAADAIDLGSLRSIRG